MTPALVILECTNSFLFFLSLLPLFLANSPLFIFVGGAVSFSDKGIRGTGSFIKYSFFYSLFFFFCARSGAGWGNVFKVMMRQAYTLSTRF
jgi:hypothetical protein